MACKKCGSNKTNLQNADGKTIEVCQECKHQEHIGYNKLRT